MFTLHYHLQSLHSFYSHNWTYSSCFLVVIILILHYSLNPGNLAIRMECSIYTIITVNSFHLQQLFICYLLQNILNERIQYRHRNQWGTGVKEAMPPPPTTLLHKDCKDIYQVFPHSCLLSWSSSFFSYTYVQLLHQQLLTVTRELQLN